MPFDAISAKKVISSLQAHRMQPGGEIMERAAVLLTDAVQDAGSSMGQIRNAEAEAIKAKGEYNNLLLEMKALRDRSVVTEAALVVLQQVAAAKKGSSKIASDWLTANGLSPVVAAVEPKV